jgi:hypothetical protein
MQCEGGDMGDLDVGPPCMTCSRASFQGSHGTDIQVALHHIDHTALVAGHRLIPPIESIPEGISPAQRPTYLSDCPRNVG